MIDGAGSLWTNSLGLQIGVYGDANILCISNNGSVVSLDGRLGAESGADDNLAVVSEGGQWIANGSFRVGNGGDSNELRLLPGGTASAADSTYIGHDGGSSNNLLHVDGGTLTVAANLDVRRGTLQLDNDAVTTGTLLATNATADGGGFITFNGGTLSVGSSTVENGAAQVVVNGSSSATYQLTGNGLHTFNNGLTVANNAQLIGNGTVSGALTVQSGGVVGPGASVGLLVLSNSLALQGTVAMEISRTILLLTNDLIQVNGSLTYGGAFSVTDIGPAPLANGLSFQLFSASSYDGAFTGLQLPALSGSLMWTNRLLVDGSLAIVPLTSPTINSVTRSGTNLVLDVTGGSPGSVYDLLTATNVTLPLASWTVIGGGKFDWMGNATITNGINRAEPQRYLRVSSANSTQN